MPKIRTFDVFDTVLTRLVGDPQQVHGVVGERLRAKGVVSVDPLVYTSARRAADADVCAWRGRHTPLSIVAEETAVRLGLPPGSGVHLYDTELQVERDLLRPVPGSSVRLDRARRETGRGVVFVSDTPHPESFVQDVLSSFGLWREGDELFGSADRDASKEKGDLYPLVAAELGASPSDFRHLGDNRWVDVARARLYGWHATHDGSASLNAHESRLEESADVTAGMSSRLAGAGRLGRLEAVRRGADPHVAAIAAGVAMPLLVGHALWVLQQAEALRLDRLYFLSRDGEVMLRVAEPIAESLGADVSLHYLHGSRLAWHLASTGGPSGRPSRWLRFPDDFASVRRMLSQVGLTPERARDLVDSPLLRPSEVDRDLTEPERVALRELVSNGPLAEVVSARARQQLPLLLRYLDQEGVTREGRVGLVDVGWAGRTIRPLYDLLGEHGLPRPAAHLFVGLLPEAAEVMGDELYARSHGWLLDGARGRAAGRGLLEFSPTHAVETLTTSLLPHTVGYREAGGRVEPELSPVSRQEWGFADYRLALDLSVAALVEGDPPRSDIDLRQVAWRQISAFWSQPSRGEAEAWGAQHWDLDYTGEENVRLAAPMELKVLWGHVRRGKFHAGPPGSWLGGTAALSPQPIRSVLFGASRVRRSWPRVRKIPRRLRTEVAMRRPGRRGH